MNDLFLVLSKDHCSILNDNIRLVLQNMDEQKKKAEFDEGMTLLMQYWLKTPDEGFTQKDLDMMFALVFPLFNLLFSMGATTDYLMSKFDICTEKEDNTNE